MTLDLSHGGATRVVTRGRTTELLRSRLRLTVLEGPAKGASTEFAQDVIRVGSHFANDLVLADDSVSAHHAELAFTPAGLRVRDLGSTNGVVASGARLIEGFVEPGTTLTMGESRLRVEIAGEDRVPISRAMTFGRMLGESTAMRAVFAVLEKVAGTDKTFLIEGETGTGKDVCANAVHDESPRSKGPFVVFDCGAQAPTLIESELFGHARGAFTGATEARPGAFERASGGTLFLDEIGELALELQPKLLRVLEERAVRRLGDGRRTCVDVRLIAATNRRLRAEVEAGRFRRDLYFRLNVIRVVLPPLRQRPEDLPLLCRAILDEEPGPERTLSPSTLAMLAGYAWPGNVRELRNVLSRAAVFSADAIEPWHLPEFEGFEAPPADGGEIDARLPYHAAKERCLERFERGYFAALLERTGGNVSKAAEQAGIPRQTVHRILAKSAVGAKIRPRD
jgi:transcriptional regulator with PAS, ATPase and Fis domain